MEKDYWQLGSWRQIPISMHWTVLISIAWLYLLFWNLLATAIAFVALLILFFFHEFGHVYVFRKRGIAIESIQLLGMHGKTSHDWAGPVTEMLAAWGGVGAQMLLLLAAVAIGHALDVVSPEPVVNVIAGPILLVWTKLNIFLMIVALLPIGPFDGHNAWKVISLTQEHIRKRSQIARDKKVNPEKYLSFEKRRELEERSAKATAELMTQFSKKKEDRKEDA